MNDGITLREALNKGEKHLIESAVKRHKGNITRVAEELDVSRPTVYNLLFKYKLPKKINGK